MQPLLLDTHTAIWITEDQPIAPQAVALVSAAYHEEVPVYVSPITAWEIGLLVSRRRLNFVIDPLRWFQRLCAVPGMRLAEMSPETLIASSFLPNKPPRDPADRILVATARDYGCTLITRDRALLDYGTQGHVSVLAC